MNDEQSATHVAHALATVAGGPAMFGIVGLLSGYQAAGIISLAVAGAMILPLCYVRRERLPCYVRGHDWNRVEYGNKIRREYKWCGRCDKETYGVDGEATMKTMVKERLE